MHLFLLRHAQAEDHAKDDLARVLTQKGEHQSREVAAFLLSYPVRPEIVLSSTAVRAMETAKPVAVALGVELIPCKWATPGMAPESALGALRDYQRFKTVLLVGHQPDLGSLMALLLGLPQPERLHVRKALLAHLRLNSLHSASLEAFIPCIRP